jgi:hypothetical protein
VKLHDDMVPSTFGLGWEPRPTKMLAILLTALLLLVLAAAMPVVILYA